LPTKDWAPIRNSYWAPPTPGGKSEFRLGAIEELARFFANSQTPQAFDPTPVTVAPTAAPAPAPGA
jgi:hypothetical protein